MSSPNYSIYALPTFYALALAPKFYGTRLINSTTNGRYDNVNPHGTNALQTYQKSTDAATFAKWERSNAAHNNAMENLPLFFASVICANMAGLNTGTVNSVCAGFLGLRAFYSVMYIAATDRKLQALRSLAWVGSVGSCLYLLIKAGNVLVDGSGARPMGL